jgi:LacI family transcriptional regulator
VILPHLSIQELKQGNSNSERLFLVWWDLVTNLYKLELSISTIDQSPLEMGKMTAKVFFGTNEQYGRFKNGKKIV